MVDWLVFACIPNIILGRCVLGDLMESTDHDTDDDWNLSIPIRIIPRSIKYLKKLHLARVCTEIRFPPWSFLHHNIVSFFLFYFCSTLGTT